MDISENLLQNLENGVITSTLKEEHSLVKENDSTEAESKGKDGDLVLEVKETGNEDEQKEGAESCLAVAIAPDLGEIKNLKGKGKGTNKSNRKDKSRKGKRKPGRPLGSFGTPYRRKPVVPDYSEYASGEVRISSRMSTSIFKHDISGVSAMGLSSQSQDESQWVYPTAIRTSHLLSGGKPPLSGFRKPSNKYKKDVDNIDPLTGKRRYIKKKKKFEDRMFVDENSGESEEEKSGSFHLSDNGIWRPTDDLRLLINMEATNSLENVYRGVKFSCYFSFNEIEERWRKLMFGEKPSLVAQNAINSLHPDVKAKIYYESLFSPEENALISSIKLAPDGNPDVKVFQTMLQENPHVFNKYRTPRSLLMHWLDLKDYQLLANQKPEDYDPSLNFEDFEDMVRENDDDSDDDMMENESVVLELKTEERNLKKKIRLLDDEINAWQAITGQIIEDGMKGCSLPPLPTDFDGKTFALLRGKEVYYGMTSREIILGRSTKDCKVDADLTEEGASSKISRKQAIIQLKRMGRFVIINKGQRPIFVDRKVVPYRCATVLQDQSVIQICQISLIFFINEALITKVVDRDVSGEIYASFKDLENESSSAPPKAATSVTSSFSTAYPRNLYLSTSCPPYGANNLRKPASSSSSKTSDNKSETTSENPPSSDAEGTVVPICQPPASYVTIS